MILGIWSLRPPLLFVIDTRYREIYGLKRETTQVRMAALANFRPVEILALDDSAEPSVFPSIIESRRPQAQIIVIPHWLNDFAEALSVLEYAPLVILAGGEAFHPSLPSIPVDMSDAHRLAALHCVRKAPDLHSQIALITSAAEAESLSLVFRQTPGFAERSLVLNVYTASPPAGAVKPSAVYLSSPLSGVLPEAWRGLPLALNSALSSDFVPESVFALIDASPYLALKKLPLLDPQSRKSKYPAELILLGKER